MAKYIGKLGTVADGLIIIMKFDTGQKLSHLVYNYKISIVQNFEPWINCLNMNNIA